MLAGVGGEGSAEPGESAGSGATLTGQTITFAHSGNFVSERVVEVNARSRRTMTAVGPMRRVCVLVSILLLGRSRHTCDAPGSYARFTSRPHVDTLTQHVTTLASNERIDAVDEGIFIHYEGAVCMSLYV